MYLKQGRNISAGKNNLAEYRFYDVLAVLGEFGSPIQDNWAVIGEFGAPFQAILAVLGEFGAPNLKEMVAK